MSKKDRKQADQDLDAFLEQSAPKKSFNASLVPAYGVPAVLATAGSAYLFYSIHALQGVEYYPLFVAVTVVSAVLLSIAYHNTNKNVYTRLMAGRPEVHASVADKNPEKQKRNEALVATARSATSSEGTSHAILYNTFLFVAIYTLLGFFLLGRFIPATYNYPTSTILSAGLVLVASRAK